MVRAGGRISSTIMVGDAGTDVGVARRAGVPVIGVTFGYTEVPIEQLNPDHPGATPWREFLVVCADTAAIRWRQPDHGIWEVRGEPRHFLYSKLMCWVALDRAIALAGHLGAEDRVTDWAAARDEIRAAILERGWNERAGAFTQAFGSEDLDASALMLVIAGFLPGDDPRVKATIDATARRLTDKRGLVYRYRGP